MKINTLVKINKLVTKVCKLFKRNGSVYPGYIIYDVLGQKDVLSKVKYPKLVIAVTGSSGKGSTTDLINHILVDNGYDVCYNKSGSNGVLAATTLILNNCDNKGRFIHDVLLLECDEKHLKLIFDKNSPTHLVITNITKDQPSRNGHPDIIFKEIEKAIKKDTTLIINADDPLVNRIKYNYDNKIITYGLDKSSDSYKELKYIYPDYAYCPKCHKKLNYKYYNYGHIGNYECPNCDFKRGKVDYEVNDINYDKHIIKINNKEMYLNRDVLYAVYYTVASYALLNTIGIKEDNIIDSINKNKEVKRGKELILDNRKLTMLESKNENNLSYYQSIKYIISNKNKKTIILGFDNVSRRYKYNDLSWLYDVDFELFNEDKNIDKIIVIGRFRYDVATRLEIANIDSNKLILVDDINNLLDIIKSKTKGELYTMVCFDMTSNILNLIKEDNNEEV